MVRWGILGAGKIAERFAASLAGVEGGELVALSCRRAERAQDFAARFGLEPARAYSDEALGGDDAAHEALLADAGVDAVYLCLPHPLHSAWAVRALRAGKAVLCEKPACLSATEMAEVASAAREAKRPFMEAMKTRFTPLYREVRALVDAGEIGELRSVRASLCNDMAGLLAEGRSYHSLPMLEGGGCVLDCGTYCASWIEDFLPKETPAVERFCGACALPGQGAASLEADLGPAERRVDIYCDAQLSLGGKAAELECAFDRARPRQAVLVGTRGTIVVDDLHRPQHAVLTAGDGGARELSLPYADDFCDQIAHFQGLLGQAGVVESPIMPLAASQRVAAILDAARACLLPEAQDGRVLERQEELLRYGGAFGAREAFELGCAAVRLSAGCDRPMAVRVVRESDGLALFQWMSDDKTERHLGFMEGKRTACVECGHSSLWAELVQTRRDGAPSITAGAFPIRVGEEQVATMCVSGSRLGLDHELCVRALAEALGLSYSGDGADGRAPAFRAVAV